MVIIGSEIRMMLDTANPVAAQARANRHRPARMSSVREIGSAID